MALDFQRELFQIGEKRAERLRRTLLAAASFFLPLLLLLLACVWLRVTPFGEHSFAISDGHYYINYLVKFGRMLRGEDSFFYSFQNGPGGNMWSVLAWGWLDPAALLAVFATMDTAPFILTWVVVLNLSLAGLCAYPLFAFLRGHRLDNLIFTTSYALIGFSVVNCYHYIFFIGIQALPLMILGLLRLLKGKGPLLYILSLAFCLFGNFYFGFMLCVFSVLLFAAFYYVEWEGLAGLRGRLFFRWSLSSLLAGLLAAPMWLSALKAYSGGGRLDQTTAEEFTFAENMPFLQIFSKLFSGANSTSELVDGLPNIFCGILTVALVILYFTDRGLEKRRKRAAGALVGFYLLSFYIKAFTLAMQGFSHTNWFPYRYSFIFSLLLIGIAAEELPRLSGRSWAELRRCFTAILVGAILVFGTSYEFIGGGEVLLDLALLLLMGLGYWLFRERRKLTKRLFTLLLLALVSFNLSANFVLSIQKMQKKNWEMDLSVYSGSTLAAGSVLQALRNWDDSFYRVEREDQDSVSGLDSYLYNYYGASHSSPADRAFIHRELYRLGISFYSMNHVYNYGVPAALDALLGLKYVLSGNALAEEKGYERKLSSGSNSIYLNENALSCAVLCDAVDPSFAFSDNAFDNLNAVWRQMSGGEKDIFTPVEGVTFRLHNMISDETVTSEELLAESAESGEAQAEETGRIDYEFLAKQSGTVYRYNTALPASEYGSKYPVVYCGGTCESGETVRGVIDIYGGNFTARQFREQCGKYAFAYEDLGVLSDYARELNSRDIGFETEKDTLLHGSFTAEAGQRILFTIPWDEGWTCRIDGQEVPIDRTWGLFMSVEAPEGQHSYELRFFPAWLDYGLYLSAAAFAALLVFMLVWKKRDRREKAAALASSSGGDVAARSPASAVTEGASPPAGAPIGLRPLPPEGEAIAGEASVANGKENRV